MSVEKTGPQGYNYQYIATLQMLLNYWEKDELTVYVENKSFEDAQIKFRDEEGIKKIELQVKSRVNEITDEEFAKWLAHFKNNKSDRFILEEIQEDNNNFLLFVTNNRCTDKVSKFILKKKLEIQETNVKLVDLELQEIRNYMIASFDVTKKLQKERAKHIEEYFEKNISQINKLFKRISIIERKDNIEEEICNTLKKQFNIPENECIEVMNMMLKIIEQDGRDLGLNIVPHISELLKLKSFRRVLQEDNKFFQRKNIELFEHELDDKNVLLLTGVPVSGKTYIAKTIAQEMQEKGVYVKVSDSILDNNDNFSFMNAPDNDCRLLLLEDPFGHVYKKENSIEIVDSIRKIISQKISSNRKIIITSRKDILLEVYKKKEVSECGILNSEWKDTSINDIHEMDEFWKKCYGNSEESKEIQSHIVEFLKNNQSNNNQFLEIGEIRHLFTEYPKIEELKGMRVEKIISEARISAERVCEKIDSMGEQHRKLFILLGCFCNTIRTVNIDDLAYILCSDEETVSIRPKKDVEVTYSIGRNQGDQEDQEDKENIFPKYKQRATLDDEIKSIIKKFCRCGYIYRDSVTKEIFFQHPIYSYASQQLLKNEIEDDWDTDRYVNYMHRAIKSLSKNAAICSMNNLSIEFDLEKSVISCFMDASNSIFPSVRDNAILFLDKNFDKLDEENQTEFMKNIRSSRSIDKYLQWDGDECWYKINNEYHFSGFDLEFIFGRDVDISKEEIDRKLNASQGFSKKEVYEILYSNIGDELSYDFLQYTLLFDEAVIRSKAMFYLMINYADKIVLDKEWKTRYENYNVVYSMLSGVMKNIDSFDKNQITLLIEYFNNQFKRKSVAMYVENLFDGFGDEYDSNAVEWTKCSEEEKEKIWKLWAILYSRWLICYPIKYMSMHEPHMSYSIEKSLKYLKNQDEVVQVGNAWLQWLDNYSQLHNPSDYGMSVLDFIIIGTEEQNDLRKGIIDKALFEKNTSIITSHISHIVDEWTLLTEEEKRSVIIFMKEEKRIDMKWIYAVALTRKNIPQEIQQIILGETFEDKTNEQITKILDNKGILQECLCVYNGYPQPLWLNGYHHNGSKALWNNILMETLNMDKRDKTYFFALRELIESLRDNSSKYKGGYDFYKIIVSTEQGRKIIFDYLMPTLGEVNKEMWKDFFELTTEKEKVKYFDIICNYIEMFEYNSMSGKGLIEEFDLEYIMKYIIPSFKEDKLVIDLSEALIHMSNQFMKSKENAYVVSESVEEKINEIKEMYEVMIKELYKSNKPRLLFTNRLVKSACKQLTIDYIIFDPLFNEAKQEFFIRYDEVKQKFKEGVLSEFELQFALANWSE